MPFPPLYINFHTTDPGYTAEARGLCESLDAHGLPYESIGVPPFIDWQAATQFKAEFVQNMQRKWAVGRPLVWLDADARVQKPPTIFDDLKDIDFAAHWLRGEEMLSGTMYFGATAAAFRLVERWIATNRANPLGECGDQRNLQNAVESMPELRIHRLPPEYTFIFDISRRLHPDVEPVILHLQASRRYRK